MTVTTRRERRQQQRRQQQRRDTGGGGIYYAADTSSAQVDQMRALVRSLQSAGFNKIVLEPWADMPKESKVILTAWDWILKQPTFDQISFVKFVRQHHAGSDAPEAS